LTSPPENVVAALRRRLGPGQVVFEYALGEERSYLFALDRERAAVFELPPARVIGDAVRAYYDAVSRHDASGYRPERMQSRALSEMLLAPARDFLDAEALAFVPDGALHYLPFGALPRPDGGPPLVEDHSVIAPLSAALLLQHLDSARLDAEPRIGIVADPVYSAEDPRVGGSMRPSPADSDARPPRNEDILERLPATGREADDVAALFPPERRFVATGTAASRALVTGGELAPYDILHIATHGRFDSQYPMLSGLWLARVDAAGQPIDGFLGIHDAHELQLAAGLVVLSGCETALGRELKAEGLVGLTHGFLYAGVPRVVASLWQVPERATAELMTAFYEGLVVEGLTPARALAAAQARVAADRRWRDPYFWAGFTLQGSW
jgi:CHAT domain-containing protein